MAAATPVRTRAVLESLPAVPALLLLLPAASGEINLSSGRREADTSAHFWLCLQPPTGVNGNQ